MKIKYFVLILLYIPITLFAKNQKEKLPKVQKEINKSTLKNNCFYYRFNQNHSNKLVPVFADKNNLSLYHKRHTGTASMIYQKQKARQHQEKVFWALPGVYTKQSKTSLRQKSRRKQERKRRQQRSLRLGLSESYIKNKSPLKIYYTSQENLRLCGSIPNQKTCLDNRLKESTLRYIERRNKERQRLIRR